MYYGARYYLPGLRRFISADNLVPNLTSQGLNRYSYVFNNPIKYIDPSGHYPLTGGGWMEESNWNGGSAWRPAAAQQPQQRLYTPPTPIQILNKELDGFGTNVNFDPGISSSRQEDALEIILEDTTQMGTTAANTYNRYQDRLAQVSDGMITAQHVTAQEAFITIYQRQNITIRNGYYVNTVNNWSGQHNGCEKSVCSFEIGLNALLGSGDDEGSNLFIHEVSHSVTIQRPEPQWYPSHLSVEVSDASGNSSPVNVRDIMAPDAGNHPPSNDCPARCETSVDIATFWILGNYDVGSTVGQRDAMTRATNLWMNPWIIQQLSVSH
jgi:hypothetical protein